MAKTKREKSREERATGKIPVKTINRNRRDDETIEKFHKRNSQYK